MGARTGFQGLAFPQRMPREHPHPRDLACLCHVSTLAALTSVIALVR
jgi:hypothetical protein